MPKTAVLVFSSTGALAWLQSTRGKVAWQEDLDASLSFAANTAVPPKGIELPDNTILTTLAQTRLKTFFQDLQRNPKYSLSEMAKHQPAFRCGSSNRGDVKATRSIWSTVVDVVRIPSVYASCAQTPCSGSHWVFGFETCSNPPTCYGTFGYPAYDPVYGHSCNGQCQNTIHCGAEWWCGCTSVICDSCAAGTTCVEKKG